jgi:hypothetical protein
MKKGRTSRQFGELIKNGPESVGFGVLGLCLGLHINIYAGNFAGFAEAKKISTLSIHNHDVVPRCAHFGPCGGCTLQSLDYHAQLSEKHNQVKQGTFYPFYQSNSQ